jgi:hypothetical protein
MARDVVFAGSGPRLAALVPTTKVGPSHQYRPSCRDMARTNQVMV